MRQTRKSFLLPCQIAYKWEVNTSTSYTDTIIPIYCLFVNAADLDIRGAVSTFSVYTVYKHERYR